MGRGTAAPHVRHQPRSQQPRAAHHRINHPPTPHRRQWRPHRHPIYLPRQPPLPPLLTHLLLLLLLTSLPRRHRRCDAPPQPARTVQGLDGGLPARLRGTGRVLPLGGVGRAGGDADDEGGVSTSVRGGGGGDAEGGGAAAGGGDLCDCAEGLENGKGGKRRGEGRRG